MDRDTVRVGPHGACADGRRKSVGIVVTVRVGMAMLEPPAAAEAVGEAHTGSSRALAHLGISACNALWRACKLVRKGADVTANGPGHRWFPGEEAMTWRRLERRHERSKERNEKEKSCDGHGP